MVEHIVPRLEEALGMNKKEAPLAVSAESE